MVTVFRLLPLVTDRWILSSSSAITFVSFPLEVSSTTSLLSHSQPHRAFSSLRWALRWRPLSPDFQTPSSITEKEYNTTPKAESAFNAGNCWLASWNGTLTSAEGSVNIGGRRVNIRGDMSTRRRLGCQHRPVFGNLGDAFLATPRPFLATLGPILATLIGKVANRQKLQ